MVGVAGRSIACHTCKQRRIRCGGEKPSCGNCIKSGRLCGGYRRNHAFVLSSYTQGSMPNFKVNNPSVESDPIPVLSSRWKANAQGGTSAVKSSPRTVGGRRSPHALPPAISSRHTYRAQLLSLFISDQCPPDIISHSAPSAHRKWLFQIANRTSLGNALEESILAVCLSKLSQQQDLEMVRHNSLTMYTKSLLALQKAIDNPASRYDEETAAACLVLGMYEFAECPGRTTDAYIRHINGVMEIIRVRGPEAHTEGLAHGILQILRTHGAFHGLRERRATFLSLPEWLLKPWSSSPKGPYDLLVDVFLGIPNILGDIDVFNRNHRSRTKISLGWSIVRKCQEIDEDLKTWFSNYSNVIAGPIYWPELSTVASMTDSESMGKLFPVAFGFPSFDVGETMVLYWTIRILLHSCLASVYRSLLAMPESLRHQPKGQDHHDHSSGGIVAQLTHQEELLEAAARCVCQSVQYFCGEGFRHIGPSTVLPSLVVLRAIFLRAAGDWSRGEAWVKEKLSQIQAMDNDFVSFIE